MQVRLLVPMANQVRAWKVGDLMICEPSAGIRLIAKGYAEPVRQDEAETATIEPAVERAIRRRGRPRKVQP